MPAPHSTPTIEVRALAADDADAWRALFDGYTAFYDAEVTADVVARTWHSLLRAEDGMLGLAAVDETGAMVGIAHVLFHRSTWSPTVYCYLEDLFVAPAARNRGVGRALIEAVYAAADARGATRTYWMTGEDNFAARSLYDALARRAPFVQYRR